MEWFKHYCLASNDDNIIKLEKQFHFAGLGFYWKLVERINLCNGFYPLDEVLNWACRGMNKQDIMQILDHETYGIFQIDNQKLIHLISHAPDPAQPPAQDGAQDGAGDGAGDGVRTGHSSSKRKDKNRKDNTIKKTLSMAELCEGAKSEEEKDFYVKMLDNYPRVCQLPQPLTYAQLNRLLEKGITAKQIADTLSEMENYALLHDKCVSANLTIQNWIRRRRQ